MEKYKLASILTRLHFCNNTKLESIEEWLKVRNTFLELNDYNFDEKLKEFGLLDKEAS